MFDEYRFFFLGGLLFTAPLSARYRKIVLIVLFAGAAIDGLAGILQFYGLIYKGPDRPHGFAPFSTIYTARLAFVPATAIVMLIMKKKAPGGSNVWLSFLVLVAVLTSGGILLSGTRGTWIAIAVACPATLLLYSPKKALLFIMGFLAVFAVLFFSSDFFRSRSISAITSLQTPPAHTVLNGTHTRFELWKGSLLLAQESPLLGIGAGDFKANIERLTRENRLRETNDKIHAHNIFFQVLATQGITGLVALLGLVAALIRWGLKEIPERGGAGGYIIILCTLLAVVGGLTDNVLGMYRFVPIFYLIVGLAGPDWSGSFEGRQRSTIDKL
jgi:O-antigen ligase